jgi:hypothetical protein
MNRILIAALLCLTAAGAGAADLQKLVQETQRMAQEPSKVLLVWWIPTEFWGEAMKDSPGVTPEIRKQFEDTLDAYMVFAVVAVDVGPMGGMTPRGRARIEADSRFIVDGKPVPLLAPEQINSDALNFVSMMKPLMTNMLGQFGQGMEFLLYPNPAAEGGTRISAGSDGRFAYSAFGHDFDWRLPLGSLLAPKVDPTSGEQFPGDYKFNPYTGSPLSSK